MAKKIELLEKDTVVTFAKKVSGFLMQCGIVPPQNDELVTTLERGEVDTVIVDVDDSIVFEGWLAGEPSCVKYDAQWQVIAISNEGTNFMWEELAADGAEEESAEAPEVSDNNEDSTSEETINNDSSNKEDDTMMNTLTISMATREQLQAFALATKVTNVHAEGYIRKEGMIALAKANGMNVSRRTTRQDAYSFLAKLGNERWVELAKSAVTPEAPAAPAPQVQKDEPVHETASSKASEAKVKTIAFLRKVFNYAVGNQKKGHGFTISAEYLKYYVFEVQFGVRSFKTYKAKNAGTPEFEARMEKAQKVARWAIQQEFIVPVTYRVEFDYQGKHFSRSAYTDKFDAPQQVKDRMFPLAKCVFNGSENVKKVPTSYLVIADKVKSWC